MSQATGGQNNYYLCNVQYPSRDNQVAYMAECEDIIKYLKMDFFEANEFKAIWRTAAARLGTPKPGKDPLDQARYDAEKRIHYAKQSLRGILEDIVDKSAEPQIQDTACNVALGHPQAALTGRASDGQLMREETSRDAQHPLRKIVLGHGWTMWFGWRQQPWCDARREVEVHLRNGSKQLGLVRLYRWEWDKTIEKPDDIIAYRLL